MNKKAKISSLQISIMVFYIARVALFGIGLNGLTKIAAQDAWISVIVGSFLSLIPLYIYIFITKKYPDCSIIEITKKLFGKIGGTIINLFLLILFAFMSITLFSITVQFIQNDILIRTPNLVIAFAFLIPISLASIKGIEVFTRMALILFFIAIGFYTLSPFGLLPYLEIQNIKPVLEFGILPILKGGIYYALLTTTPIFLLLIVAQNNIIDSHKYKKDLIKWLYFTHLIVFIKVFLILAVLGPKLTLLYKYPDYTVLKKISFLNFIERVENNIVWNLILNFIFTLVTLLFFIKEVILSFFSTTKKGAKNIIIISCSLILLIIPSFILPKFVKLKFILKDNFTFGLGISIFLLTVLIFIKSLFDKNKNQPT